MSDTNGDGKMPLQCVCGQKWSITPKQPEIFNNLRTSGIILDHGYVIRCPSAVCSHPYIIAIQGFSLNLSVVSVNDEVAAQVEGSPVIKPNISLIH